MAFTQNIISKHIIKPSVPTPNRFKIHKLSYFDQITQPIHIPLLLFYQIHESEQTLKILELLKQSLSRVLAVFYPFAGIIIDNSHVDCNDTGVEFVEAQVHAHLAQFIKQPKLKDLKKLVHLSQNNVVYVKFNLFDCGGIGIGVTFSHKVADFASVSMFMNEWASMSRGETQVIKPLFDLADHFPPKASISSNCFPNIESNETKRFVFDREKLEKLQQLSSFGEIKNPTKVEALTAFIWQQYIETIEAISGNSNNIFVAYHAINLRSRSTPPIPEESVGNCVGVLNASASDATNISHLVSKLRVAKNSVDDNYIKEVIIVGEENSKMLNTMNESLNSDTSLVFTRVWRYPAYHINFGWGTPMWVTMKPAFKNTICFMSTPSKDGIEALINMSKDVVQRMEMFCYIWCYISYSKLFTTRHVYPMTSLFNMWRVLNAI